MTQSVLAGVLVAALFGVLIGSALNGRLWQQVGLGVLSAVIAFVTLRKGALLYDRVFAARNSPENRDSKRRGAP